MHWSQRPILLKGHERSITVVKYNRDGKAVDDWFRMFACLIFPYIFLHAVLVWFQLQEIYSLQRARIMSQVCGVLRMVCAWCLLLFNTIAEMRCLDYPTFFLWNRISFGHLQRAQGNNLGSWFRLYHHVLVERICRHYCEAVEYLWWSDNSRLPA